MWHVPYVLRCPCYGYIGVCQTPVKGQSRKSRSTNLKCPHELSDLVNQSTLSLVPHLRNDSLDWRECKHPNPESVKKGHMCMVKGVV